MLHTPCQKEAQSLADTGFGYTLSLIGGKYKMLFSHGLTQQSMQTMDELIAKVRKERNMPEPAAKGAYKSKGLSLSKEAAR